MEQQGPKLADVARAAGVSRATASRAINGLPGTTDAVRQRVRGIATQLGFQSHAAARALATGRTSASRPERIEVLIVDPDPNALSVKPYYGRVLAGAMHALENLDVALQVRRVATAPTRNDDPPRRSGSSSSTCPSLPRPICAAPARSPWARRRPASRSSPPTTTVGGIRLPCIS